MRTLSRNLIFVAVAILFSGCIGSEYTSANNAWKLGYSEVQLNQNVYRVSYAGYGIPQSACDEFALMRAAELTRERGFKYFMLVHERQSSSSQITSTPGTYNASTGLYTGGSLFSANYPVSSITIEMLNDDNDRQNVLDADLIWKSLTAKLTVPKS
jgi:hypothetical protein|tara:strand:+ start:373 stop:840 length:468 start_codon:yes stop_codon:yes gene_type:complete